MKRKNIVLVLSFFLLIMIDVTSVSGLDDSKIEITGQVENPYNITMEEILNLPMITEEVSCICVGSSPDNLGHDSFTVYEYNWTGIPVTALLEKAKVKEDAFDVVFYASDSYSSSLPYEYALKPENIIAVKANGEFLNRGTGYPFRLIVPCWWGYKWVKYIERIEVVNYDHLGTWENRGFPDIAEIPGCEVEEINSSRSFALPLAFGGFILLGVGFFITWKNLES